LESNKIAADLATIRVAGEAGERMMSGKNKKKNYFLFNL